MSRNFCAMGDFYGYENKERISCPVCGEMFKAAEQHAYSIGKNQKRLVCSYTCMRKWEKGEVKKLYPQSREERKSKRYDSVRVIETGEIFGSIKECAIELNTTYASVHQAIKTGCHCRGFHIEEVKEGEKNDD